MDIYLFLKQFVAYDIPSVLIVAGVVGGAVFGIIQGVDQIAKNKPPGGVGINPSVKFWTAIGLCVVIPFGAYVLVTANDKRPLDAGGIILAAGVSFLAATALHWVTGASQKATSVHEAELHKGMPVTLETAGAKDTEIIVK